LESFAFAEAAQACSGNAESEAHRGGAAKAAGAAAQASHKNQASRSRGVRVVGTIQFVTLIEVFAESQLEGGGWDG